MKAIKTVSAWKWCGSVRLNKATSNYANCCKLKWKT